jgi:hypothetical protein
MTNKTELLPCPFDGSHPYETSESGDERDGYSWTVYLTCKVCGCSLSESAQRTGKLYYHDEKQEIVRKRLYDKWNTRV